MSNEIILKIIDMINNDKILFGASNEKRDKFIYIKYDKKNDLYTCTFAVKPKPFEYKETKKEELTLNQIIEVITNPEFSDNIIYIYNKRINREKKYNQAKKHMYKQLYAMDLTENEISIMEEIIETVSLLPDQVGFGNSVTISSNLGEIEYFSEEVRLSDETLWDTAGDVLHLQLVQTRDVGMTFHQYPKLSFEELVKYICSKKVNNNKQKIK